MHLIRPLSAVEIKVYQRYRIVHGIRIGLSFVLTLLLVRLTHIPEGTWPLITMVVIMGPLSYLGNVVPRAIQRIGGTILGSCLGLIGLQIELYSLPLMFFWCFLSMVFCGFLTLGKRPYQALLIGITLAIVIGGPVEDIDTAVLRGADVILGSLLAMLFTWIWPQRAFIHWRMKMAIAMEHLGQLYQTGVASDKNERPEIEKQLRKVQDEVVKMRPLLGPCFKETKMPKSIFEAIQTLNRNLICVIELQMNAFWASRKVGPEIASNPGILDIQQVITQSFQLLSTTFYSANTPLLMAQIKQIKLSIEKLDVMMQASSSSTPAETPLQGYLWLCYELLRHLERLSLLTARMMRR